MIAPRQIWRNVVDALFPSGRRARALYASAVAQARQPAFYARLLVPDTPEGRFEMIALHVILLIERLMRQAAAQRGMDRGARAAELAREVQERLFDDMDASLREMGVSDVAVPRRIRKLGVAFYDRMARYHEALARDDAQALKRAILRHIYAATEPSVLTGRVSSASDGPQRENDESVRQAASALAQYALLAREVLKEVSLDDLRAGNIPWPAPPATIAKQDASPTERT